MAVRGIGQSWRALSRSGDRMKVINSNREIKIYERKYCHSCKADIIYTRYPKKPHKNKKIVKCDICGFDQRIYGA